jgi:hypothetical protein
MGLCYTLTTVKCTTVSSHSALPAAPHLADSNIALLPQILVTYIRIDDKHPWKRSKSRWLLRFRRYISDLVLQEPRMARGIYNCSYHKIQVSRNFLNGAGFIYAGYRLPVPRDEYPCV